MRDPNRIDSFLAAIGKIWKDTCPDWRFGQLICNLQRYGGSDLFYLEEEDFLALVESYLRGY